MIRFRRSSPEVRFEMTPLIDVVFLLLTFFIFALVLMVRANVLDVALPEVGSGPAAGGTTVTIAINKANLLFVDGEPIESAALVETVRAKMAERPGARLVIAADRASASGVLIGLADLLSREGLGAIDIIGVEPAGVGAGAGEPEPGPPGP